MLVLMCELQDEFRQKAASFFSLFFPLWRRLKGFQSQNARTIGPLSEEGERNLPSSYKISPICNYGSAEMLFIAIVFAIRKVTQTADRAVAE